MDALHYATAKAEGVPLLAIDRALIGFLVMHGYTVEGVITRRPPSASPFGEG